MTKISNDELLKRVKKRKIIKSFIIIFGLLTIGLSVYSLVTKFSPIPALITFIIEVVLTNYRNKTDIKGE